MIKKRGAGTPCTPLETASDGEPSKGAEKENEEEGRHLAFTRHCKEGLCNRPFFLQSFIT